MATFLPGSGALAMSTINGLFGRGNNLNSYRGTTYYTSTTGPNTFPSTPISFSNFYNTGPSPNAVPDLSLLGATYLADYTGSLPNTGYLEIDPSGAWYWFNDVEEQYGGYWVSSGAGTGIGSAFWLRITRTSTSGTNGSSTASTGWVNMGTTQYITVTKNSGGTTSFSGYYTLEISNSSSGSPVLSSRSGILFTASRV